MLYTKHKQRKKKIEIDTRILDIALRYKNVSAITDTEFKKISKSIIDGESSSVKKKLSDKIDVFEKKLQEINADELGQDALIEKIEEQIDKTYKILQFFG